MTLASQKRIQPLEPEWVRYLNHRVPGETPGINDSFLTTPTVIGTGLTVSGTATYTQGRGRLHAIFAGQTSGDAAARIVTLTSPAAPYTIETRFTLNAFSGTTTSGGLAFSDGTTAGAAAVSAMAFGTNTAANGWRARFGTLTALYATTNTTVGSDKVDTSQTALTYVRVIWVSSNSFKVGFSYDGNFYTYATLTPTFTPTSAVFIASTDGGAGPAFITFDYLRGTPLDLSA